MNKTTSTTTMIETIGLADPLHARFGRFFSWGSSPQPIAHVGRPDMIRSATSWSDASYPRDTGFFPLVFSIARSSSSTTAPPFSFTVLACISAPI